MANTKSIYKYLTCPCGYKKIDSTGKAKENCKKCNKPMSHSENWHVRLMHQGVVKIKSVSPRRRDAEDYLASRKVAWRLSTLVSCYENDTTGGQTEDKIILELLAITSKNRKKLVIDILKSWCE